MKPVKQTLVCGKNGTCMQAALASLFETDINKTIDVMKSSEKNWMPDLIYWVRTNTVYEYKGIVSAHEDSSKTLDALQSLYAVNGFFYGVVPSRNFKGESHALIIDRNGIVVHDPNPDNKWLGVDTVLTKELEYWYRFESKNNDIAYHS